MTLDTGCSPIVTSSSVYCGYSLSYSLLFLYFCRLFHFSPLCKYLSYTTSVVQNLQRENQSKKKHACSDFTGELIICRSDKSVNRFGNGRISLIFSLANKYPTRPAASSDIFVSTEYQGISDHPLID